MNVDRKSQPVLSMWCLGKLGKFGNQVFQYAFLKICAEKFNLVVETEVWVGQKLFGHQESAISKALPPVCDSHFQQLACNKEFGFYALEKGLSWYARSEFKRTDIAVVALEELSEAETLIKDVDLWATGFSPTRFYAPYRDFFRLLFRPTPQVEKKARALLAAVQKRGKTLICIHIRRGDFWQYPDYGIIFAAPIEWYLVQLREIWAQVDSPVLVICSDEPDKVLDYFQEFHPFTSRELSPEITDFFFSQGLGFYPDFYLMSHADRLVISNSSFSVAASMLNERCNSFFRPDPIQKKMIEFDPWNTDVYLNRIEGKTDSPRTLFFQRMKNFQEAISVHSFQTMVVNGIPCLHKRVAFEAGSFLFYCLALIFSFLNKAFFERWGKSISPRKCLGYRKILDSLTKTHNA